MEKITQIPKIMSQITTHVLDTSKGKPAEGITITLAKRTNSSWEEVSTGFTDSDGRIADLLGPDEIVEPGVYRMLFHTGDYFEKDGIKGFYPRVPIVFEVFDDSHYHVPLLLNPFGYSTYRGS